MKNRFNRSFWYYLGVGGIGVASMLLSGCEPKKPDQIDPTTKQATTVDIKQQKQLIANFYQTVFDKKEAKKFADAHFSDHYKQHMAYVGSSKADFIEYFNFQYQQYPESSIEIKRIIAEGDIVVVHSFFKLNPDDLGQALADIFRIENGKIAEYWHISQIMPEQVENDNGMF